MYFIHHTVGSTMQQQSAPEQMPPSGGPPMGNKFSLRKGKGKYLEGIIPVLILWESNDETVI